MPGAFGKLSYAALASGPGVSYGLHGQLTSKVEQAVLLTQRSNSFATRLLILANAFETGLWLA